MQEPILSYFYNGKHYYSKFAVCEAALLDGVHRKFLVDQIKPTVFKDYNYFNNYDWTKEPQQSWYEMCVQRAHELRQNHKYLALAYSGGSDCAFILDIFIKNNIPLDEIYTVLADPFADKILPEGIDSSCWEIYNHAIPYMKYIEKEYDLRNTKFIIHNNYKDSITGQFQKGLLTNYNHTTHYSATGNAHYQVVVDYKAQDKFILNGGLEPNVYFDGRYHMDVWDTDSMSLLSHSNYIPFYLDKNKPEMHAKQCHLLMKYFKQYGYSHRRNNYENYHKAQISSTRAWLYDFSQSPYFIKNVAKNEDAKGPKSSIFVLRKAQAFVKALRYFNVENWQKPIRDYYLEPKIKGIHLYDLPIGFPITRQYLE